jgi:UDPglucose--hexose-1-phosphate uridylyltransferase
MQELRVDALTGEQVILAPARALRPDTFRVEAPALAASVATCPFCAGNESETPPEVARVGPGTPDTPGWRVRVVPNKYPIVGAGVPGAHEVVILSPAHDADFAALSPQAATDALLALRDRAHFHLQQGSAYAQPFVNFGKAGGASIEHPHAQLVALETVPPRARGRLARFADAGRDLVKEDLRDAAVVIEGDASLWCQSGSVTPFSARAALAAAQPRFDLANDDEIAAIAAVLREGLARLHAVLGGVAYNVVFETAPSDNDGPFHWWLDIIPRVTVFAGFEIGTGVWVNVVPPEQAAAALRDASI